MTLKERCRAAAQKAVTAWFQERGMQGGIQTAPLFAAVDAVAEVAYIDGHGSSQSEWFNALTEYCNIPPDVEIQPTLIAHYISRLQRQRPDEPIGRSVNQLSHGD